MNRQRILSIANTIKKQLIGMNDIFIIMSWGAEEYSAVRYEGKPALKFKVCGRLFKGYVIIALNGHGLYEIYLVNHEKTVCISSETEISEVGGIIDVAIEKGVNRDEYELFCILNGRTYKTYGIYG